MNKKNASLRITITYLILSLGFINIVGLVIPEYKSSLQINMGMTMIRVYVHMFIIATSIAIYYMIKREINKRIKIENELLEKVNIYKSSKDAIVGIDLKGRVVSWSPGAETIFGYDSEEVTGSYLYELFGQKKQKFINKVIEKLEQKKDIAAIKSKIISKANIEVSVVINVTPIKNVDNELTGVLFIIRDMTKEAESESKLKLSYEELTAVYQQLAATEEELRIQYAELKENQNIIQKSEERYKLALDGVNDVIWEWNPYTGELFTSEKFQELTGHSPKEVDSLSNYMNIIFEEDRDTAVRDLQNYLSGIKPTYESEFRVLKSDGSIIWLACRGKVLRDEDGNANLMAGSLSDITERVEKQAKITELAYYDIVTKLPNRAFFNEKLRAELHKENDASGMVILLDLDDFKRINDSLGHDYGDELLTVIGKSLEENIDTDGIVARFGGDEFLILVPNIEKRSAAKGVAEKILSIFNDAFHVRDKQIYVTASAGVTIYPEDGESVQSILKNTDTATYTAKENGKNTFCFFDKKISQSLLRRIEIEKGLRGAIDKDELILNYQPQINVRTSKIQGLEALIRWNSKELGTVSPMEFIPIAEEIGIIKDIGEWVLRTCCAEIRRLKDKNYEIETISVNVSAVQLQEPDFTARVQRVLEEEGIEPELIEIEITESILMTDIENSIKRLKYLRDLGVKIALDDFGTGFSSLSYLRMLPLNTLKIDRAFIKGICYNQGDKDITDGIIQLAHKIGLEVVSEGVEEHDQVELLNQMNCNVIQGYYYSKPVLMEQVEVLLEKNTVFK